MLFVGGDAKRLASVQIRCVDIAQYLGCDHVLSLRDIAKIPNHYSVFICVKTEIDPLHLGDLKKRGIVLWDVMDSLPPREGVDVYITGSMTARDAFACYGRAVMIRPHHCNNSLTPNSPSNRRIKWIGGRHWKPDLHGFEYDVHYVENMPQAQVIEAYRETGIGLNVRATREWSNPMHPEKLAFDLHLALNPGIKLINCIGFGIPSVSAEEPAYREIDAECTVFSSIDECADWVHELQNNETLYNRLRQNCLKQSARFDISSAGENYKKLLQSI